MEQQQINEVTARNKLLAKYPLPEGTRLLNDGESLKAGDRILYFGFGSGAVWIELRPWQATGVASSIDFYARKEAA